MHDVPSQRIGSPDLCKYQPLTPLGPSPDRLKPYTSHIRTRVTNCLRKSIFKQYSHGKSTPTIADELGVSKTTVLTDLKARWGGREAVGSPVLEGQCPGPWAIARAAREWRGSWLVAWSRLRSSSRGGACPARTAES